jgi:hypothetical protein
MLLSLLGVITSVQMFWVHPKDLLMSPGTGVGWLSGRERLSQQDVVIDAEAAERLAFAYFRLDPTRRQTLHIPLDRLDRASRNNDLADRSIDLGIALEALVLHELDGRDRGELRFRLSLRGAWLSGNDSKERAEIQRLLKDVYDLRSAAVHTGIVAPNAKNRQTIGRGADLCNRLIRQVIEAEHPIKWDSLVLGGRDGHTTR